MGTCLRPLITVQNFKIGCTLMLNKGLFLDSNTFPSIKPFFPTKI